MRHALPSHGGLNMKRIFLLNGHPDPSPERFCAALVDAYASGARRSGHEVRRFDLGAMEFPLIRSAADSDKGPVAEDAARVQDALIWADHSLIVFPLWLDDQPALLRALFEQVFRYGFVHPGFDENKKALKGKTAHTVVSMGMNALAYRWKNGAYCVKALEKGLYGNAGIRPVRRSLIGSIHSISEARRKAWLKQMQEAGAAAR
jgi:putative NADPH-quinone reductase